MHWLAYWSGYGWEWLVVHAGQLGRLVLRVGRFAGRVIRIEAVNAARFIARQAVRFWRWVSPYLWQFDRWLGVQVHKALKSRRVRELRLVLIEMKKSVLRLVRR